MLQEADSQYLSSCRVKILGIAWCAAQGKPRASLDGSSQGPNSELHPPLGRKWQPPTILGSKYRRVEAVAWHRISLL